MMQRLSRVLAPIAFRALERRAQPALSTFFGCHPVPNLPGRIVTHVLLMAARELRHPVPLLVLMKTCDALLQSPHRAAGVLCLSGQSPSQREHSHRQHHEDHLPN
ncbi:MAG: hypothetical protein QOH59_1522 [Gemmatimonadales bacterium]|nr:hypothetical protein [Gemmatimonadales bacterium]